MPPTLTIETSCLFIQGHECYEVLYDFSAPIAALFIFIFGISHAFKKLSKQHDATLKQQDADINKRFKIELFKEFTLMLDQAIGELRSVSIYCRIKRYPVNGQISSLTAKEMADLQKKSSDAMFSIITKVESHEIVHPLLFKTFRFSLQSIWHNLIQLQHENNIKSLDKFLSLTADAMMYMSDFQICMQNMAWGGIFGTKVEYRDPIDPSCKVIKDNDAELKILMAYFDTESEWGEHNKLEEQKAKEIYSSQ